MRDPIQVICDNLDRTIEVEMGTSLLDIRRQYLPAGPHPYLAAYVNNRIKELNYKVYTPITVRYIDATHFEGIRVYERTATFLLQRAVCELWPGRKLYLRHSMLGGFYCEFEGRGGISPQEAEALRTRMRELVEAAIPITRSRVPSIDAAMEYTRLGFDDKTELLNTRPRLYSSIYALGDTKGYFYGALAPSTDYVRLFDIRPYYDGFCLVLPGRSHPDALRPIVAQDKLFDIFRQYKEWVAVMGVPTVGRLNAKVLAGDASELIKIAEAFHEKRLARIADTIAEANRTKGTRMVLISGPSSSGKTTSAKRLGIQLRILGLNPVLVSLDDYFVDRDKTPRDADGEYDYEALEAIDLQLFNDHLQRLFAGESLPVPRYDFLTGKRQWHDNPLRLDERSVLIVEGIHGLNPRLTPSIPDDMKFRIYISCFTSVSMDNLTRIATTDNRLLRRMVRDNATRGHNAQATLARWESVRRGEERHIFPYQENADVMFNSSLFYEISVLRPYAERILREVPDTVPEYGEARRLLKFLDNFIPIDPAEIPPTSLLREFIGGSSFRY
ncbi:nucleoside kinase [Alistipes sp.]|uniref:nucleoside kinase n=1 Tax=Alistipes sp. TaxID=1872444 RepID=UPI003A84F2A2